MIGDASQKQIEDLRAEQTRLRKVAEAQAPSASKDYFLNAPLLDFLAPTIKINQLILPDVVDDVNFKTVPKMDRCTTCHLAIDNIGVREVSAAVHRRTRTSTRISAASRRIPSIASAAPCATTAWGSR